MYSLLKFLLFDYTISKKGGLIMSKDYARLIRIIYGERRIIPEEVEVYNNNPELAEIIDEMLLESWGPYDLEYLAINDFILEGKDHNDFVSYIKENAEDIAKHFEAMALRRLRHPKQSGRIRPVLLPRVED